MLRISGEDAVTVYGVWSGDLAYGCSLCFDGDKSIIYITGTCHDSCYYCPIAFDKRHLDSIYIDEERVSSIDEIISYIDLIGVKGASITGGDPLIRLDLVVELITRIKDHIGSRFHIHLYTSGRYATLHTLKLLDRAGLDEIRFHPIDRSYWSKLDLAVKETSIDVGVEVPVIPGQDRWLKELIAYADRAGCRFVNLNELEVAEPNKESILLRGLTINDDGITVKGSRELAVEIVKWARSNVGIPVHFCPARFKDTVQTFRRLRHKSMVLKAPHQAVMEDGILRWVEVPSAGRLEILDYLVSKGLGIYMDGTYYLKPVDGVVEILRSNSIEFQIVESIPEAIRIESRNMVKNIYVSTIQHPQLL